MKSVFQEDKSFCFVCGLNHGIEEHHIFYGTSNRKLSEKRGYKVHLCYNHHRSSRVGVHGGNSVLNLELKEMAQNHFEETGTREEFIKLFGKSYL